MYTVYLSPSTQEDNIGVGEYGTEEARMNEVADVVQRHLNRQGIKTYRNFPEWSLGQVVRDSNSKRPDVHLSIHSNAANGKARGAEVFCHRFGGEGERFARAVYEALEKITPTNGRGVKQGADFYGEGKHLYETAYTAVPAALIEIAFHDQADDAEWIISNIPSIGSALAQGILNYFSIPWRSENIDLIEAVDVLHQAGMIDSPQYWKENAVAGKQIEGEYAGFLLLRLASYIGNMGH